MTDQPHVETTPELSQEQAAELAEMENMAAELGPDVPAIGPEKEPEKPSIPTAELIEPLVSLLCATVAPAWDIKADEQKQLSGAYAAVVDKYFPDGVPMGPEVGALMVTAAIVMPRLGQPMKAEEPETAGAVDADK